MISEKQQAPEQVPTPSSGYKTLFIRSDTGVPALKDSTGATTDLVVPGDASGVTYTPADSLNWTDSVDPGNVDDALDDLAARTSALEDEAAPDAAQVTYTPQTSLHWTDSEDPGNVDDALDDLASRVQALEEDSGAGLADGNYGDVTVSGSGTAININAGTVGPTELANTAVSPNSYTLASITVDQQGRLTAASNGSVDASQVGFTPTNSVHWTDSEDPGDVDDALNDLAARVQGLEETESVFRNIAVSGQGTIVADGSNDTLTLAAGSNITLTTDPTTDTVTIASSGSGVLSAVARTVVTGAAATTVSFTSLNLDAAGIYIIKFAIANTSASSANYNMHFNGDTTAANYHYQQVAGTNNATNGAEVANALMINIAAGQAGVGTVDVHAPAGSSQVLSHGGISNYVTTTNITAYATTHLWKSTDNVTQIDFTADVASAIGIGSYFEIYKLTYPP